MTSTLLWYKITDLVSKKPVGLLIGLGMLLIRNVKILNKVLILLLKRRKKKVLKLLPSVMLHVLLVQPLLYSVELTD